MKNRLDRVNEVIKRELSELIQREITFAEGLVAVQQVDITPNLKQAHVYVGVIGSEPARHAAMAQLHDHRVRLQKELSRRVVLKYTPHLHFHLDESVERGTRILSILEELHLPEPAPEASPETESEP